MEASEQRRSFGDRGGFRGRGRSNSRGRGGGDRGGGFRGGRGNFRGRGDSRGGRGGFRGGRGDSPGGFRGGRGGSPGGFRGGRGGSPGGFRGGRGSSPGGFRGGRGSSNFRGRGGFQRDNDKANGVESTEQQGGFRGRGSFRSGSRGRDSRGRGNFRGSGFRGERGGRGGRGGRGQGRPSSDNSFLKNIKTDSEQKTNEKQSTQDVKRKQKLAPSDTKQAVLISNLPKKVETVHKDFQAFISKTVGPVKLITYNKLTTPKSAAVSAICVFEEESDFKAAIEKLHGQEFSGHHLLVQSFKDSKFDTHHTSKNCVCVANMADKTTEEDLWKLFEGCGDLGMIHINRNTATGSPYEAVVNFKDRESVSSAVDLDGSKVLESTVKVVNLDRKFSVLVTNIDRQLTNQEFRDFFSECNLVYFSFGAKKKKEQKTAFVFLADEAGYKKALKLNGNDLKGQPIKVVSSAENSSVEAYDVFSPMIPSSVSPAEAKKVYEAFGTVTNVLVPLKKNISRISFETEEQAQAAVQASKVKINGAVVSIHPTFNKAMRVIKKLKEKTEKVEAVKGSDTKKVKELKAAAIKTKVAPKKEVEEESDSDDDSGDELETEGNVKMEHEDDDDDDDEAASGEEDEDSAEDEEEEEDSDGEEEEEEDSAEEEEEDVSNGVMDLEAEEDEDEEGEDEDEEGDEEEEEDEMEDSAEDEDEGDSDEDMEVEETPKFKMNTKKTNGNKVALAPSPKVQNVLKRKMKNSGPIPKKQKKMTKK